VENRHQYRRHFDLHQRLSWQGGDGGRGAITGVLLSSGGYIANQTQSDGAMLAIKACYLYIPALLIVASMLWMGRFYRLDDQYEQIRADLDAGRRAPSNASSVGGENHAL
jgi:Na+/melibiose symporter-like transporter